MQDLENPMKRLQTANFGLWKHYLPLLSGLDGQLMNVFVIRLLNLR